MTNQGRIFFLNASQVLIPQLIEPYICKLYLLTKETIIQHLNSNILSGQLSLEQNKI
jgi:hypothetical protein